MKNTKDIILETALALFNSDGMAKVTLRTIASTMGISQGNLNYHFKKREDIVEALYFQIVEKMDAVVSKNIKTKNPLETLFYMSKAMMYTFYEYRFFMLDFVSIIRGHPQIKAHYMTLLKQRELEFLGFIEFLVNEGIMRDRMFTNEYKNLFKRFQILSDFWMSSVIIDKNKVSKTSVNEYSVVIHQTLFPYLTLKGQEMYKSLSLV